MAKREKEERRATPKKQEPVGSDKLLRQLIARYGERKGTQRFKAGPKLWY